MGRVEDWEMVQQEKLVLEEGLGRKVGVENMHSLPVEFVMHKVEGDLDNMEPELELALELVLELELALAEVEISLPGTLTWAQAT